MRDIHYKNRVMRTSDKTWEELKKERKRSKLSWNMFMVELLEVMKYRNEKRIKRKMHKLW